MEFTPRGGPEPQRTGGWAPGLGPRAREPAPHGPRGEAAGAAGGQGAGPTLFPTAEPLCGSNTTQDGPGPRPPHLPRAHHQHSPSA